MDGLLARRRAAAVHGRSPVEFDGTATVVIGDTPLDISAARSAGARAVGVATGSYSADDLAGAGPWGSAAAPSSPPPTARSPPSAGS